MSIRKKALGIMKEKRRVQKSENAMRGKSRWNKKHHDGKGTERFGNDIKSNVKLS